MKPIEFIPGNPILDLSAHNISYDDMVETVIPFIKNHSEIVRLFIRENNLCWRSARLLSEEVSTLLSIDISGNKIGDFGAFFFARNYTLHYLEARDNHITEMGYNAFLLNSSLQVIDLRFQTVGQSLFGIGEKPFEKLFRRGKNFPKSNNFNIESFYALSSIAPKAEHHHDPIEHAALLESDIPEDIENELEPSVPSPLASTNDMMSQPLLASEENDSNLKNKRFSLTKGISFFEGRTPETVAYDMYKQLEQDDEKAQELQRSIARIKW